MGQAADTSPGNPEQQETRRRMYGRRLRRALLLLSAFVIAVYGLLELSLWATVKWIESRGESLNTADFLPQPIPPDQNGATQLFSAFDEADAVWEEFERFVAPFVDPEDLSTLTHPEVAAQEAFEEALYSQYFSLTTTPVVLPVYNVHAAELSALLNRYASVFAYADIGLTQPACQFEVVFDAGAAAQLPHLSHMRGLASLYALRGFHRGVNADVHGAIADVEAILRLAMSLEHEPIIISQLVRMSLQKTAIALILAMRETCDFSVSELDHFADLLEKESQAIDMAIVMKAERAVIYETDWIGMSWEDVPRPYRVPFRFAILQSMADVVDAVHHPYPEQLRLAKEIERKDEHAGTDTALLSLLNVFHYTQAANARAVLSHGRYVAWLRALSVAYRLEADALSGTPLPSNLDALPEALRIDPFSGKNLRLRSVEGGLVVYSVGMNLRDDGGTRVANYRELGPEAADDIFAFVP